MQQFNIELDAPSTPLVLYAMQADSLSRFFQMTITQGGTPWAPPAGAAWTVRFGATNMPDGWYDTITEVGGSTHPAVVVSDNVAVVEIAEQAVSVPGQNVLCVLVTDATGYQIASWQFQLLVTAVPGYDAPEATTYYNALTEQVAQTLANAQAAAASAVLSQSWAVGNTGTRDGENTNNAQYWSEQAAQSAQQAVGFRTMQGGAVIPVDGDIDLTQPYPTKTNPSVTITSAENRIDSVTINGYTTQTGSGDPSPTNIRPISNVGKFNTILTLTGTEAWNWGTVSTGHRALLGISGNPIDTTTNILCTVAPGGYTTNTNTVQIASNTLFVRLSQFDNDTDATNFKAYLAAQYAAGTPVKVAYISTSVATEAIYTGIAVVQSDNYQCNIIKLQAPLHAGDTLKTNALYNGELKCVETHAKATVTVNGQTTLFTQGTNGYTVALLGAADGAVICNAFSGLSASSQSVTIPSSAFPPTVTSLETANTWAKSQNVVIEYTLSTPEVYADTPIIIDNPQGTYTVSGESGTTCQVYMEPLQNGGVANAVENSLTLQDAEGETQLTYDGSAASVLELTKTIVGLSNVDNTADASKYVKGLVVNSTSTLESLPTGLYYYNANTPGAPDTQDGLLLVLVYGAYGAQLAFPTDGGIYFRWAVSNFSEWARLDQ